LLGQDCKHGALHIFASSHLSETSSPERDLLAWAR